MRLKSSFINLKSKLLRSCNRFISFFQALNVNTTQSSSSSTLLSCLCFLNNNEERISQIRPRSSSCNNNISFVTLFRFCKLLVFNISYNAIKAASVIDDSRKMSSLAVGQRKAKERMSERDMLKEDDVKEACRNFENYLIHVMVEEGKTDELMDIEEFLYYWKNLNNPIFVEIVTRFYGELCMDLFPNEDDG